MTCAALGLPLLGHNQRHPAPIGRRTTATMDNEEMWALFPAPICWLLFSFFLRNLSQAAREVPGFALFNDARSTDYDEVAETLALLIKDQKTRKAHPQAFCAAARYALAARLVPNHI